VKAGELDRRIPSNEYRIAIDATLWSRSSSARQMGQM